MSEKTDGTPSLHPSKPGSIRITQNGKMRDYIAYALQYLRSHEEPLTLHTLPRNPPGSSKNDHSTTTIPRLISVVEIIKREYLDLLVKERSTQLNGLFQYNSLGNLEDMEHIPPKLSEDVGNEQETRAQMISNMLNASKQHSKRKQTPFMKVVLSRTPIAEGLDGFTSQTPLKRTLSKSAKMRAKKKAKKGEDLKPDSDMEES
ncbi:hypothetical protein DL96DRAFT_1588672 [Flagelloscypha sp. PMI_526]|nr:hypothetical protein DL96DRAFT_1588672 [Flagelloscypha sp. PMI_526]